MNKSIAVAGTGYVGLSISVLLAQHNHVVAVDIIPEKIALINQKKSPIQDEYIEKYLSEKELDLTATSDGLLHQHIYISLLILKFMVIRLRLLILKKLFPVYIKKRKSYIINVSAESVEKYDIILNEH